MPRYTNYLILYYIILYISCRGCNSQSSTQTNSQSGLENNLNNFKGDPSESEDGPCMIGRTTPLTRLDGVKVGHVINKDLGDKVVNVITRALKPPVFEIPNFLSSQECDYIIKLAKEQKLRDSFARGGLTTKDEVSVPKILKNITKCDCRAGKFYEWDKNHDGIITTDEAILFVKQEQFVRINKNELLEIFHKVNVTEMEDGKITYDEFQTLNTYAIDKMIYIFALTHPKHRHRYSKQTWINQRARKHDRVLGALQERILKLTGLSKEIIYGSEKLQVVHYAPYGHYHAHYDSETHTRSEVPCCHHVPKTITFKNPCRICRYITILYYLNDVESGGETAFPVADNSTLNTTFMVESRSEHNIFNLNENCNYSNLVVKPKKGLAIMWYNHHHDNESGWLGPMDDYSLHGGCAIHRGTKWIANNWITAPYKENRHIPSVFLSDSI